MDKYVKYEPGTKHVGKEKEISESHDVFEDCGYLLKDDEVVIDIDHLPFESIKAFIKDFNIDTRTVWTNRGVHFYFKKPYGMLRAKNGPCALGFPIETKNAKNSPNGVTIKQNGVLRKIENADKRMELPWYFSIQKKFEDLSGLADSEGRNNSLFAHKAKLDNHEDTLKILRFINEHVFSEPLDEKEFETVCRDYEGDGGSSKKEYDVATSIMNQYRCVVYQGTIWFWNGIRYVTDVNDDIRLKQVIFERCPGKPTRFVDEVMKQILYRGQQKYIEAFPIRFKNGIVTNGEFIPIKDYKEFTPFYIDVDYKDDAAPVKDVDDYINNITGNDDSYRMLLTEAMAYVLITDPEMVRSIGQFFILRGEGKNGKGTMLQIMKKIYGEENCTALSIKELADMRYQVTMIGKLVNLGDDVQPEAINNDQMKVLKNICTADTVSTRLLFKQSFTTTYTTKLFFTTNADLHSFEKGYAYQRRVCWLPMFNKIEKPDPRFITKMTTKEAIAYWVRLFIDAYKRLYKNGKLTECQKVIDYNKQYHIENNYMAVFLETVDLDNDIIGKTGPEVKRIYQEYNDDDSKPYKPKLLKDALKDLGIGMGVKKIGGKATKVFMKQEDTSQKLK